MKNVKRKCCTAAALWCVAAFLLTGTVPAAALMTPLYITTEAKITDGWGAVLHGNSNDPEGQRDRFEIRYAEGGMIYAPLSDGTAAECNPLVENGVSFIGSGIGGADTRPGMFSIALLQGRPGPGAQIFVRVYDAHEVSNAVHYADSQIITVPSDADKICYARFGAMVPLDRDDSDGDSLPDAVEVRLGSSVSQVDSDGDGMSDAEEFRAGTDLLDADSSLALELFQAAEDNRILCRWPSVSGMRYRLQYRQSVDDPFLDMGDVLTAVSEMLQLNIQLPDRENRGQFRVRLVED